MKMNTANRWTTFNDNAHPSPWTAASTRPSADESCGDYDACRSSADHGPLAGHVRGQLRALSKEVPGGLTPRQMNTFRLEIMAGIRYGTLDEWRAAIDSAMDALAIGLKARCLLGRARIPEDRMWRVYDPCMTTKWRDAQTAARFQEFVRRKQEDEHIQTRAARRASAARRKEILERGDLPGSRFEDLIKGIVEIFAVGLLRELGTAHKIASTSRPADSDLDGWDVIESGSTAGPSSLGGLFAKWTPTPGGMHDKALGLAPLIRTRLIEMLREKGNQALQEEVLRSARDRTLDEAECFPLEHLSLQRDILTPLRRAAEVPEHFIGAGTAKGGVNYRRMASRCRVVFGEKVFRRLDRENYDRFLADAAKPALLKLLRVESEDKSAKVNAGTLVPHEVMLRVVQAEYSQSAVAKVEAGLQWQALLDSCRQPAGSSKRLIIPMCDVSGSMDCPCGDGNGTCMDAACALSLLLADSLPEDNAFHGKILTFSESPEFVDARAEKRNDLTIEAVESASSLNDIAALFPDLAGRVQSLKDSPWGYGTNFFGAIERICDVARENGLAAKDVEGLELVVFSDMEFDQAQYGTDYDEKTMFDKIRQLFVDRFGPSAANHPPKIVFWNLRASQSGSGIVESAEQDGVALFSGLSAGLIRKYLTWDPCSPDRKEGQVGVGLDTSPTRERPCHNSSSSMPKTRDDGKMNPTRAMIACIESPMYNGLRLEKDLQEWEVLVSEEEIMWRAEKVRGENMEAIHRSNSSALVALFFEAVPGIHDGQLVNLLAAAFEENPMVALKLLFNLGSVRKHSAGKADRENFQVALMWLWKNWPETYLLNLGRIARFSSLKELLNSAMFILYESKREEDPDGYALYSLVGQRESLERHQSRQKWRDNAARRKRKRMGRLRLWSEFAIAEGKDLFGDMRIEVSWKEFKEKLRAVEQRGRKRAWEELWSGQ